jgi:SAM-dependent methyltransferase
MEDNLYRIFDCNEERHWWFLGRREIVLSLVDSFARSRGRPAILDIGCGAGGTLRELEDRGFAVGVDISHRAIDFCRRRGCRRLVRGGDGDLPFASASFDLVIALDLIEHIDDDRAALAEYRRLLKTGGMLLLTVPAYRWLWSWHDTVNRHRRRYTFGSLRKVITAAGLIPGRISYFCFFLFPLVALFRILEKILARAIGYRREDLAFRVPPGPVNRLLAAIFASERRRLARSGFPFGSSLLALARREPND